MPLRGTDVFSREGGDLDFMVPAGRAVEACYVIARAALEQGWFLANFRDIGYLAQVVLIMPDPAKDSSIKIDFFDGLRWYGVGTDSAGEALLQHYSRSRDLRVVGAASFFQKTLTVGRCSDRDWQRVCALGADPPFLVEIASSLSLPLTSSDIHSRGAVGIRKWKLRAASGGSHNPLSNAAWFLRAAWRHFRTRLAVGTKAGLIVGVSGLDGSGKSTLVDRLISSLREAGALTPGIIHLLPSWIPMPHQILRRKKTSLNYTKPYSEPPVKSRWSARARLAYYLAAFFIARLYLAFLARGERMIVLDRSFVDFASDLSRARIPDRPLPEYLVRALLPPGLIFYLRASPEAVVTRKGELSVTKAKSLERRYEEVASVAQLIVLDGNLEREDVYRQLLARISTELMDRLRAQMATP
jgi:thymidylate kinase